MIGHMKAYVQKSCLIFIAALLMLSAHRCTTTAMADTAPTAPQASLMQWVDQARNKIRTKTLANGLTILFYPVTHTTQVRLSITYNVGSANEQDGQYGLAHLVEHMIFKGTPNMSEVDIKLIADKFGNVEHNACTTYDQTSYYFVTDNKNWPVFLGILADCMQNARFDENHLASEVKAVLSELRNVQATPSRNMIETALQSTFPIQHPYHHSIGGSKEDLARITAHDLQTFYRTHYGPEHATLIVVGNIDENALFTQTDKLFGPIPSTPTQQKNTKDQNAFINHDFVQKNITLHTQTENALTLVYWQIPGLRSTSICLAQCLRYILAERLKPLKDQHDLVYATHCSMIPLFDASLFIILFEPKTEISDKKLQADDIDRQCITLIRKELDDLMTQGPTDAELTQFKQLIRSDFADGFENITGIASTLSDYCLNHNVYETFDRFAYLQNITANDIKTFCQQHFDRNVTNQINSVPLTDQEKLPWLERQRQIDIYEQKLFNNKQRISQVESARLLPNLPKPQPLSFSLEKPDCHITLANGLDVYIKQRTHTPGILVTCGFKDQEAITLHHQQTNKRRIPQCAMELVYEESAGSAQHPSPYTKKEHDDFFDAHGASCSFYLQGGECFCLPDEYTEVIQRFFYILTHPTIPEAPFKRIITNYQQKLIFAQQDDMHVARQLLTEHLLGAYPWTISDGALLQEIHQYTRRDVQNFCQAWINPTTMFVTIVGNIDKEKAIATITQTCQTWQSPPANQCGKVSLAPIAVPEIENPTPMYKTHFLAKERVRLIAGRLIPVAGTDESIALQLLETYLNHQLYEIRDQTGLFYYCYATLQPRSFIKKSPAMLMTQIEPHNLVTAQEAIKKVLRSISDKGIPEENINIAKFNYVMEQAKAFSTNAELSQGYQTLLGNNLSFSYYEDKNTRIKALSSDFINRVARTYCNPDTWTFVAAGRIDHATT